MVGVALIGSGRMGSFHGETLGWRLPGVRLVAAADPAPGVAEALAKAAGGTATAYTDVAELWDDPEVEAVVIAAPARFHADLAVAAAEAGKHVFCEKPMALSLADADRVIDAARAAGVLLRVGFNRRFAPDWTAARALVDDGRVGTPRLLRSVTRDPGGFDPARIAPGTIFNETLIHDFDTLRFLNPGAEAVEVYAVADALVEPEWRDRGLLDTAVVTVRFSNGAVGTAEACFEASYGYDVRGEVLGDGGMVTMGDGRRTGLTFSGADGRVVETSRGDQELFGSAYIAELASFTDAIAARATADDAGGGRGTGQPATAQATAIEAGGGGDTAEPATEEAATREPSNGETAAWDGEREKAQLAIGATTGSHTAPVDGGHWTAQPATGEAGSSGTTARGGERGTGWPAGGEDARAALAVALAAAESVRTGKPVEVAK